MKSDYYTKKIEDNKDYLKNTWNVLKKVINRKGECNLVKQNQSASKFKRITPIQIHNLIMKSANGKATSVDVVSSPHLKTVSPKISPQLADICNQCIEHGTFPNDLKIGKVIPIFKSVEKDDPGNYRPISMLSAFARIVKKLLYQQLYKFLADNRMLGDKQWGF